jgi:predicted dehydrogenase
MATNSGRAGGSKRLGVGFIGAGFNARFHMQGWTGVRDADVQGVWSPDRASMEGACALARKLGVGEAKAYKSIAEMVADPAIDAIWLAAPNFARVENVQEIVDAVKAGKGELRGIACEKPLGRTVQEAAHITQLIKSVNVPHGYLENQVFAPHVVRGKTLIWARGAALTGRPYLARAAEEHSGPHSPWFWQGNLQGGGVLNDMMCHSAELVRFLLTEPGKGRSTLKPVRVTGHIASLKWTLPQYIQRLKSTMGKDVDYAKHPSEDFASAMIEYETGDGRRVLGEATTTWSFVGAGLRLSAELLGPEYSLAWNTLDTGLKLFFSREVKGQVGEDLIEKQNAEMGLMPVVPDEATVYGYEAEDRHFVHCFRTGEPPLLTWDDGLEVVKILMATYLSAERGETVDFPPKGLEDFVPAVARGAWHP